MVWWDYGKHRPPKAGEYLVWDGTQTVADTFLVTRENGSGEWVYSRGGGLFWAELPVPGKNTGK